MKILFLIFVFSSCASHQIQMVDGKVYDSISSIEIYKTGLPGISHQALYKKETGEFFLIVVNFFNAKFVPLTEKEAHDWAGSRLNRHQFEKFFTNLQGQKTKRN